MLINRAIDHILPYHCLTASPTPQNSANSSIPSSWTTVLSTSKQTASAVLQISFSWSFVSVSKYFRVFVGIFIRFRIARKNKTLQDFIQKNNYIINYEISDRLLGAGTRHCLVFCGAFNFILQLFCSYIKAIFKSAPASACIHLSCNKHAQRTCYHSNKAWIIFPAFFIQHSRILYCNWLNWMSFIFNRKHNYSKNGA